MSSLTTFIDTSALVALSVQADAIHDAAMSVMDNLLRQGAPLATSDLVITEFLNHSSRGPRRAAAATAARRLYSGGAVEVFEVDRATILAALDLYESRPDQSWSLVDCSSMLICKQRRIKRVFTHDRHFKQAGFQILL